MDALWSPWRYQYITGTNKPKHGCIFCDKPKAADQASLIIHRATYNFVLLNLYPYTNGHLLIAPYQHAATLQDCSEAALAELMQLTRTAERVITGVYQPQGINLGMNLGECAGAGVAGHIHMHLLPRWTGDASFLSVIGETRVLPEELPVTWERLRQAWPK
jgi:ATP adenylyltransferase